MGARRDRLRPVPVTVRLDPLVVLVLDGLAAHLRKSRDETMADALRCYFAVPAPAGRNMSGETRPQVEGMTPPEPPGFVVATAAPTIVQCVVTAGKKSMLPVGVPDD
jgi:hypothetical protein